MEATMHFIISVLQETIKYQMEDILSYVDWQMQGLRKELTEDAPWHEDKELLTPGVTRLWLHD
jgi:hypothetical protein